MHFVRINEVDHRAVVIDYIYLICQLINIFIAKAQLRFSQVAQDYPDLADPADARPLGSL